MLKAPNDEQYLPLVDACQAAPIYQPVDNAPPQPLLYPTVPPWQTRVTLAPPLQYHHQQRQATQFYSVPPRGSQQFQFAPPMYAYQLPAELAQQPLDSTGSANALVPFGTANSATGALNNNSINSGNISNNNSLALVPYVARHPANIVGFHQPDPTAPPISLPNPPVYGGDMVCATGGTRGVGMGVGMGVGVGVTEATFTAPGSPYGGLAVSAVSVDYALRALADSNKALADALATQTSVSGARVDRQLAILAAQPQPTLPSPSPAVVCAPQPSARSNNSATNTHTGASAWWIAAFIALIVAFVAVVIFTFVWVNSTGKKVKSLVQQTTTTASRQSQQTMTTQPCKTTNAQAPQKQVVCVPVLPNPLCAS